MWLKGESSLPFPFFAPSSRDSDLVTFPPLLFFSFSFHSLPSLPPSPSFSSTGFLRFSENLADVSGKRINSPSRFVGRSSAYKRILVHRPGSSLVAFASRTEHLQWNVTTERSRVTISRLVLRSVLITQSLNCATFEGDRFARESL